MTAGLEWDPRFELCADGIPKQRYTSPQFARLEAERLWTRTWQMACRLEEIPEPGDYTVYDVVDQSVLLVRQRDGSVAAFHNVCPHRGTALAVGTGSFANDRRTRRKTGSSATSAWSTSTRATFGFAGGATLLMGRRSRMSSAPGKYSSASVGRTSERWPFRISTAFARATFTSSSRSLSISCRNCCRSSVRLTASSSTQ